MAPGPTKYVVMCQHGEVFSGRIDDNRVDGDGVVIDPENPFVVRSALLHCEKCGTPPVPKGRALTGLVQIRLTRHNLGELLDAVRPLLDTDAVRAWLDQVGLNEMLDGRRVIPFNLLCTVNGELQRRKTRPRQVP